MGSAQQFGAPKMFAMRSSSRRSCFWLLPAVTVLLCLPGGCKKLRQADLQALYQSGLWSDTIQQLHQLKVSDSEVSELLTVHQAGLSDEGCVQLIRFARSRQQMFAEGDDVANLLHAGISERDVLELDRLGQLEVWVIEAQSIRLAGYSDAVIMAVARRRAAGLPTLSSSSLVELKNTGMHEENVLALINRGLTDEQAGEIVAVHEQSEIPHGFVRRPPRRPR
jgi:hypothetical protein